MESKPNVPLKETIEQYLDRRWADQVTWFEQKASFNQKRYMLMRHIMLVTGWLTPAAILSLVFIPPAYRDWASVVPFLLSGAAIGSYQ